MAGLMPLYMDRHDLPDATATDIATAHLRDLESVEAAHRDSHGMLPTNVK